MIRSPGTKRWAAMPIPEEIQLKLRLLGVTLLWDRGTSGWMMFMYDNPEQGGYLGRSVDVHDVLKHGWDAVVSALADTLAKPAQPAGWRRTQQVDSVAIPAASVIDEEAFNVKN